MGRPFNDLTGLRFGRLTVTELSERTGKNGERYWKCECDCGSTKDVSASALLSGYSKSCGCLKKELLQNSRSKNKRLYQVWQDMKQRCYNPKNKYYRRYGGRGISVCEEWLKEYEPFYQWAISNGYEKGLQLDRTDNDGNYCPENCRWATPKQNSNNRSCIVFITYAGETHTRTEWAEITGIPLGTIKKRYKNGKTPEEILCADYRRKKLPV